MTQPLIDLIAAFPEFANRLLVEHADDGTGHCPGCPVHDPDAGGRPWPCALHDVATMAARQADTPRETPLVDRPPAET